MELEKHYTRKETGGEYITSRGFYASVEVSFLTLREIRPYDETRGEVKRLYEQRRLCKISILSLRVKRSNLIRY